MTHQSKTNGHTLKLSPTYTAVQIGHVHITGYAVVKTGGDGTEDADT